MDIFQRSRQIAMQALLDILYKHQAAGNDEETIKIASIILEVTE